MTEEQRKQIINALTEWILNTLEYESSDKVRIAALPEAVRALIELSESCH